ncbi:hypothetical protein [Sphingorhabdus sp. 109]|uniref:hypothetical protein n=1 Tax=Sphingorhabdus sp. 109 TaxID=2653173 RepID=UPI00135B5A52|nr:hypothetical protein [Sphingorhabdus sp. 109]
MPVPESHTKTLEIEVLRQITDALHRAADRGDRTESKLDDIGNILHKVDNRLTVIENNSLDREVERNRVSIANLDKRVLYLEASNLRREGAMGIVEWGVKNWPAIIGFFILIAIILEVTGQINIGVRR